MNDDNESSGTLHCQRCCWVPFPLPQKHFLKENGNAQTWISWEGGGALLRSGAMIWMLNFYTTLPWAKQSTSAAQDSLHNQLSLSFQICKVLLSQRMTLRAVWCFQPNAGKQGDKRGFEPCRVHLPGAGATASPDECLLLKCCITAAFRDACSLLLIGFSFSFTPTPSCKGSSLSWRSCADQCTSLYLLDHNRFHALIRNLLLLFALKQSQHPPVSKPECSKALIYSRHNFLM